jgi:hypothetical protein
MSFGNQNDQGGKLKNYPFQYANLKLLEMIANNTAIGSGADYELVTTYYEANKNGVGYSTGNSITRTQVYQMPAGALISTIWFNQSTGLTIAAPPIADIDVVIPPTAVTVNNLPVVLGQLLMAQSLSVTIASNQTAIPVTPAKNATSTLSNVAAAAADTRLLNSNVNRSGAMIFNDSTSVMFLNLGGVASSTSFTVRMTARAYYEVPFGYTGDINGRWVTATGAARVTEITP